ncbi:MAG: DUF459 domain-containing protein, partial [Myxococcota bacterium]
MSKNQNTVRAIRVRWSSATAVVVTLWVLLLLLSFYQAQAIRDEIDKSEVLREQKWLRDGITSLMKAGDQLGMAQLREKLGAVRAAINAPYTVLEATEDENIDEATDTGTVDAEPDTLPHLSVKRPRRVLVIGASSIQFAIGVELEKRLPRDYAKIRVKRFGQLATGLSRPDFMDWPKKLHELAKQFKPDLVICNFGGNDAQSIPQGEYGSVEYSTPAWDDKYGERVTEIIDIAKSYGADTVMLGMPIMRSPKFSKKMRRLNRVMKKATETAGMLFVPTYKKASTPEGKYRTTVEYKGRRGLMRTSDGVHYTRLGARFVIEQAMKKIERRYRFEPKDDDLAPAQRHGFTSPSVGEDVWYTAYVPRKLAADRPAVVLLPGDDSWGEWPEYPHRSLQQLAQKAQVVIIVPENAHRTAYVGPQTAVLRDELPRDLTAHLPVSSVLFAGTGRGAVSALAGGGKSAGIILYRP